MSGARGEPGGPDRDMHAGEAALAWARAEGVAAGVAERARARRRKRRQLRRSLAGGAAAVLLLAGVWLGGRPSPAKAPPRPAHAPLVVSAPARQVLPDGSIVELRPGARIALEFGPAVRGVRLEQGEAHFAVAKNKDVPFVVRAGALEVRAVGTAFSVELGARSVDVLVTEGRVAIEQPPGAQAAAPLALLEAGQAATVALAGGSPVPPSAVSEQAQRERLAWRVPRIELSRTPLVEVVECFNRHSATRLELADPALGSLLLSGALRPDSPQALLHVLRNDFGLRTEPRADGTIVIRPRPAKFE